MANKNVYAPQFCLSLNVCTHTHDKQLRTRSINNFILSMKIKLYWIMTRMYAADGGYLIWLLLCHKAINRNVHWIC